MPRTTNNSRTRIEPITNNVTTNASNMFVDATTISRETSGFLDLVNCNEEVTEGINAINANNVRNYYSELIENGSYIKKQMDEIGKMLDKKTNKQQTCNICKENITGNNIIMHNFTYCEKCAKYFLDYCSACFNFKDKHDIFLYNGEKMCSNCLTCKKILSCFICGEWDKERNLRIVKNVGHICKKCYTTDKYFYCDYCNNYYENDRYGMDGHCINCVNSRLESVNNYSYKPSPKFYHKNINGKIAEKALYFGVELEIGGAESYNDVNDFVEEYSSNFFYMKKDTSIPIYGCEIVTQPATLTKHKETFWEKMLYSAKEHGLRADLEKCGIHVHISRNFFNTEEIAIMDYFVNNYKKLWKKLAQRESHYSSYVEKNESMWGKQTTNRRCALNLSNPATIELRVFKSSLDYNVVMAYIELCHALSYFVKNISLKDVTSDEVKTINVFKNFVYSEQYTFLKQYCENLNIFN